MTLARPGVIAIRAVNDYRRRDVLGFLGLRYYIANAASRTDRWARTVSPGLVAGAAPAYLRVEHFKDFSTTRGIEHRDIFIPTPNECIAEGALLAECASRSDVFGNEPCVYSYVLNEADSRSGSFRPYMEGLRRRQKAIAEACDSTPDGFVQYMDMRKFYPSIGPEIALRAWSDHCRRAQLEQGMVRLGEAFINNHASCGLQSNPGILTGPMFSHLVANLILREVDRHLSSSLPVAYFRYVDDIVLGGRKAQVKSSIDAVRASIESLGLKLHEEGSPKNLVVPASEWVLGSKDFETERGTVSWMTLIADVKRHLLQYPAERERLRDELRTEGFRIPVRDYSAVVRERDFAKSLLRLAPWRWFRRRVRQVSVEGIVESARVIRQRLVDDCERLLDGAAQLRGYERKRRLSKLRYCIARLVYLASDDRLKAISRNVGEVSEMYFHARVMDAVASRRIDQILSMGTNAAQAVAQPLRATGEAAMMSQGDVSSVGEKALGVFIVNGIRIKGLRDADVGGEVFRFAKYGSDAELMMSQQPALREIACLHGLAEGPRHEGMLELAVDEDEALTMDAVAQLQQSKT